MKNAMFAICLLASSTTAFAHPGGYNTGITGGAPGVKNNKVPHRATQGRGHNTGITGGAPGVKHNRVP